MVTKEIQENMFKIAENEVLYLTHFEDKPIFYDVYKGDLFGKNHKKAEHMRIVVIKNPFEKIIQLRTDWLENHTDLNHFLNLKLNEDFAFKKKLSGFEIKKEN